MASWQTPSDWELLAGPVYDFYVKPQHQALGLAHSRASSLVDLTKLTPMGLGVFPKLFGEQNVAGLENAQCSL